MAKRGNNNGKGKTTRSRGLLASARQAVRSGLNKLSELAAPDDGLDAMDLLKAQHRYVDKLFAQIQGSSGAAKAEAFRELADMLAVHATIEERIFYPSVRASDTEELLRESVEEHLAVKRVLADMLEADVDAEDFDAKLSLLQEQVVHHAREEEEGKLFPQLRASLDRDYLAGLAGEMIALMVELQQQGSPRDAIPAETSEAAPI